MSLQEELAVMIAAEEKRLGVGSKEFMERYNEIMQQIDRLMMKGGYKGGKIFTFHSYAKLIYSANEMPVNLDEKSEAFYRWLLSIEVKQKGPYIQNLKQELEKDMPGFIHECVNALSRMYVSGKEIDSPNSKKLVHEFHRESDSVLPLSAGSRNGGRNV